MTDYYPLIGRAVAGLDKNTGESRRALYERARTALVAQLRGLDPPLTESEITRERLALEEAIRKVESEAARKARLEVPRVDRAPPPPPAVRREEPPAPRAEEPAPAPPQPEPPRPEPPRPEPPRWEPARAEAPPPPLTPARREQPASGNDKRAGQPPPSFADAAPKQPPPRKSGRERPPPLTEEGLKGFRDVVAEAETLGEATAQAARTAREAYVAVPSDDPELDRMEPRLEPVGLRTPVREGPPRGFEGPPRPLEERPGARPPEQPRPERTPPRAASSRHASVISDRPPRSTAALVAATMAVLVIVGLAMAAYWWREPIKGWFGVRTLPSPTQPEEAATKPKIPDRVGQPSAPRAPAKDTQVAAVAQRVVLYEEDPADAQGKRYIGSAIWRTETVSPGPGQAPELAIRGDFEIPDRGMSITMSIRRNTDQALPASHTIELMFKLPADFPFGGINNMTTILMKQEEQARGAQLAGLVVKVSPTLFLVGLTSGENEIRQNIKLLKERAWFDIPILYGNNQRAILAIEKGNPGDRAFAEAFAAWGQ